jgi:hypothetical protein
MKASVFFLAHLATVATSATIQALEPRQQQAALCKQYEYWSASGSEMNKDLMGQGLRQLGISEHVLQQRM